MQIRMGERLQTHFDLPDDLAAVPVPPLLLQPLVENCIKHGLEPKVAGGRIDVSARREGGQLVLQVHDTGAGLSDPHTDGTQFGLLQVKTIVSVLFRNFEMEPVDTELPEPDYTAMVVGPKNHCLVRYKVKPGGLVDVALASK
jgi:sensor histidine kinase YesM